MFNAENCQGEASEKGEHTGFLQLALGPWFWVRTQGGLCNYWLSALSSLICQENWVLLGFWSVWKSSRWAETPDLALGTFSNMRSIVIGTHPREAKGTPTHWLAPRESIWVGPPFPDLPPCPIPPQGFSFCSEGWTVLKPDVEIFALTLICQILLIPMQFPCSVFSHIYEISTLLFT